MRVFKTGAFTRFCDREGVDDQDLCDAIRRAEQGLIDADLGGGVIKQRIARKGQGKSGAFRSMVLFQSHKAAFFIYGFAKSGRSNIRRDELKAFRKLANEMLAYDDKALAAAMQNQTITELRCHG